MVKEGLFMAVDSGQALSVSGILREALKIPKRNGKLMVSILLLVGFPYLLLVVSHDVAMGPSINRLVDDDDDEGHSKSQINLGFFLCIESIFFLAWCGISFLAMLLTIYASAMTYTGKYLSLKETASRIISSWRKPTNTWICVALISIAYAFLLLILVAAFSLIALGDALVAWIAFIASLAALFYVYLAVVWILGFAISIIEDNCGGMDALGRASKLIQGRRVDGFVLMLLLLLLGAPISLLLYLNTSEDDQGIVARVAVGTVGAALACLLKLFTYVVFTVFYCECKKYHGERMEGSEGICLLSNIVHVSNSLP